jgi:glycosyltransferase involved in cell wall biosynthesis
MFETDRIPSGWAERINGMDEVWVPTKFQAEVFEQNGVDPSKIVLMPEAVDVDFFNPEDMKMLDLDKFAKFYEEDLVEKFRFMSVFKWEKRKAWDVLLRAYLTEFSASEKVVLFIVTNPYHAKQKNEHLLQIQALKEQIAAELNKKIEDLPRVLVVDKHILQRRMPNLYKSAHVLIIPSRGEGWGRPHVEAMSMEVPVIATNWSGPTEFMTEENSFPLQINGLVPVGEGPFKDHMWADPSLEHLKERMRFAFSHPEEVEKRGKKAREDMVAKYSPRIIGDMVINRLKAIEQKLKK